MTRPPPTRSPRLPGALPLMIASALPLVIPGPRWVATPDARPSATAPAVDGSARRVAPPAILDHLPGRWVGEGELFGRPTRFAMTWGWELGDAFLGLGYEIRGEVRMEATAHYRVIAGDTLDGVWVDSRGEIVELAAVATDSTLETEWRSPSERGRTVYRRTDPDSLHVQDFVRDGAEWRLFGSARYARR